MRAAAAVAAVGAFAQTALAASPETPSVQAKNVIYIVPDGYGQSSQTMARDLVSLIETGSASNQPSYFSLDTKQHR